MFDHLIKFVQNYYSTTEPISLHSPVFAGNESAYVSNTIRSTFVSSVGAYVDRFEADMASYTGAPRGVAVVNGTAALHLSLLSVGVGAGDLVITQSLTFVASCNAISYCGGEPVFVDVDRERLTMSPFALDEWLTNNAELDSGGLCRTIYEGRPIKAVLPMHTFGHPTDMRGISEICSKWNLPVIEDAAEALGSFIAGRHVGTFGICGALSFNGNKLITTGGGGMILTDAQRGQHLKHISTTAKRPHAFEYEHDETGYNYRLPNLNAALGCAQLERLTEFLAIKRQLAMLYKDFFSAETDLRFVSEPDDCKSNYWLNAVVCENREQRDVLLTSTNQRGVMTRPIWGLMHRQPMFREALCGPLDATEWLSDRVVNLPSSVNESALRT